MQNYISRKENGAFERRQSWSLAWLLNQRQGGVPWSSGSVFSWWHSVAHLYVVSRTFPIIICNEHSHTFQNVLSPDESCSGGLAGRGAGSVQASSGKVYFISINLAGHPAQKLTKKNVPVTGARQFMSNYWLPLQKLPEAHKVVLCSPSPFHKNTNPLIYLRGSGHQKSESVNTQWRVVMFVTDWIEIFVSKLWLLWWFGGFKINLWASERAWEGQ